MKTTIAEPGDLPAVAVCHRRAFPHAFSSKLGTAYLTKMYGWYVNNPKTFLLCLRHDGRIVGFVGGMLKDGTAPTGSASGMTQFSFTAAIRALLLRPWLLFHPVLLTRYSFVLKNIRMKIFGTSRMQATALLPKRQAGLIVIGVDPAFQGKGFGRELLIGFEETSVSCGFKDLQLSVRKDNETAIRAYERNGWTKAGLSGDNLVMEKLSTTT